MYPLFESIKVFRRKIYNLSYHEARVNKARNELWGIDTPAKWCSRLNVPSDLGDGLYKCRVIYGPDIKHVEFVPYIPRSLRSMTLVYDDEIEYSHKYENRVALAQLWKKKGDNDDILIVKNGLFTDSTYCNIAFWDGAMWHSPSKPLLAGTQRAKLVEEGRLTLTDIPVADLDHFAFIRLFNAMMEFEEAPILPTSHIYPSR